MCMWGQDIQEKSLYIFSQLRSKSKAAFKSLFYTHMHVHMCTHTHITEMGSDTCENLRNLVLLFNTKANIKCLKKNGTCFEFIGDTTMGKIYREITILGRYKTM